MKPSSYKRFSSIFVTGTCGWWVEVPLTDRMGGMAGYPPLPFSVSSLRYGRRAYAVAGRTVLNSLPDNLRDPDVTIDNCKRLSKSFLVSVYQCN